MTKDLNLTLNERGLAIALLNHFKGGYVLGAVMQPDSAKLKVSLDELKAAPDFKETPVEGGTNITWTDEKSGKDFTLEQETVDYLLKELDAADYLGINDAPIAVSLKNKLK